MDINFLIGNIAAMFTTISFLPQAIQVIKTKNTQSLSLPMYLLFVTGVSLWIVYGLQTRQMPVILGNIVTVIFAGIILTYKVKEIIKSKN